MWQNLFLDLNDPLASQKKPWMFRNWIKRITYVIIRITYFLSKDLTAYVLVSRRFGVNPDNVATPVAAALGDLVTLALLSLVSSLLLSAGYTPQLIILLLYIVIAVYCYRSLFHFKLFLISAIHLLRPRSGFKKKFVWYIRLCRKQLIHNKVMTKKIRICVIFALFSLEIP